MHQKRKYSQYRALLHLQYPLLRLHHIVVQELENIIFRPLIFLPKSNYKSRYQVVVIFIKPGIPEYLRIINIGDSLLFVDNVEDLTEGYFFIGQVVLEVLLEHYVVYQVLVFDA
jgi:hypothetical protein